MNRKYLVLPAVLLVAAAVVAAIQLWPSPLKDLRAKNLCLGMLTEETAGLLYDRKGGKLVVDEFQPGKDDKESKDKRTDPVFSTTCFVGRETDKGNNFRGQYSLDVRSTNTLNEALKGASPFTDGGSGWVSPRQSEVQLPASCPKKMRTTDEYVTIVLKVAPGVVVAEDWDDAALIEASRPIVQEAVANLTKQYECG
ncbi:hypothetical protein AB0E67_13095 [Streptomyces sp. NPDC032161]|uniref:hypothetical protein n=1 Tax=unclassified Streptomyces TaxID=2593676 RepID=UPI0033FEAF4A